VSDVGELSAAALLVVGQVEVVTAHGELAAGSDGHGVAVNAVLGGPVGAARNLLVRAKPPALVVVPSVERGELVAPEVVARR
jgi:hypothetical protein